MYGLCYAVAIMAAIAIARRRWAAVGGSAELVYDVALWAVEIDPEHRPSRYAADPAFHPTFLYELLWNLLLAAALVALGRRREIRPPGLFALYVAGYCAFRIVDELLRVDPAAHLLGVRWNLLLAIAGTVIGLAWFAATQRRRAASAAGREPGAASG